MSVYLVNKGENLNNLLKVEDEYSYKPFKYPEAYNFYSVHEDLHWTKN